MRSFSEISREMLSWNFIFLKLFLSAIKIDVLRTVSISEMKNKTTTTNDQGRFQFGAVVIGAIYVGYANTSFKKFPIALLGNSISVFLKLSVSDKVH